MNRHKNSNQIKIEMDEFLSKENVFTINDERAILEQINNLEQSQSPKSQRVPKIAAFLGVCILFSIIGFIIIENSSILETSKNANENEPEKTYLNELEKQPEDKEVILDEEVIENEQKPELENNTSNLFEYENIQVGDLVNGWEAVWVRESPNSFQKKSYSANFRGDMEVSGTLLRLSSELNTLDGQYVFVPDDNNILPRSADRNNKGNYLVSFPLDNEGNNRYYNIPRGGKLEKVTLRISGVTTNKDSDDLEEFAKYDYISLYYDQDYKGDISKQNQPETIILNGVTFINQEKHGYLDDAEKIFSDLTGGVAYGIDGSDYSFIRKGTENILSSSLNSHIFNYEYVDAFKVYLDYLYRDYPDIYQIALTTLEKFIESGETQEFKENDVLFFRISDDRGRIKFEMY